MVGCRDRAGTHWWLPEGAGPSSVWRGVIVGFFPTSGVHVHASLGAAEWTFVVRGVLHVAVTITAYRVWAMPASRGRARVRIRARPHIDEVRVAYSTLLGLPGWV